MSARIRERFSQVWGLIALSAALILAGLTPVRTLLLAAAAGAMLGRPLHAPQEES